MIIKEFSDYLKLNYDGNIKNGTTVKLLSEWIKSKIERPPKNLVDKVIQKEIYLAKNKFSDERNEYFLIGKSKSGRILINALYNFALSFEQQDISRKIHNLKSSDIKKC